jgi:N-acetylglucosaminyldiphosphoundecaprenol N-acetyl-beta-D-mannosaminyltransferase
MEEALARCVQWCLEPRSPHTVITANAAILCTARRDPQMRSACRRAQMVVADGMSVVWTSRLAGGAPLPERVAGVDMMVRLLEEASSRRLRAYFLGARPEVVAELVRRVSRDYPGLVVAGHRDGYFGPAEEQDVIAAIRDSAPHMLFVGMPSPFKDTWCERHRDALGVPVILGVGGTFDVLAGFVKRAPRRLQGLGLEWLWRLAMEPRRMWRRYLVTNTEYVWLATGEILRRRLDVGARPDGAR